VAAVEALLAAGGQGLDPGVVRAALADAESPGRLEVVRGGPTVLVDAAHNPAGAAALADAVREAFSFTRLVGLVGVLADKDAEGILGALEPVLDEVVVTRSTSPRAIDPDELGALAVDVFGEDRVHVAAGLVDAVDTAIGRAEEGGLIGGGVLATGSITLAAEVRRLLLRPPAGRRGAGWERRP
jgi:dihydrofolate synthase/folylpolyglutamate synthase